MIRTGNAKKCGSSPDKSKKFCSSLEYPRSGLSHPLFSYPIDSRSSLPRSKETVARDYSLAAPSIRITSSIPPIPKPFYPYIAKSKGKGKTVPLQARTGPEGSKKLRFPDFVTTAQNSGRLSALRTGRLYPRIYSWYSFLLEAESTPKP